MLLVLSIPVITQNSAGDVWFIPASQRVLVGDTFTTEIHANSGSQNMSAYVFDISYNQAIISPDKSVGNGSIVPGPDGFVSATNPLIPGILTLSGFDAMEKGPGADLHILTIHWNADATGDSGKLHVTIYHTWFDNGCIEKLPRVRFGTVHLYNNLYASNTNNYCIGLGKECRVRVENSVFVNQKEIWRDWGGSSTGEFGWSNLKLEGSSSLPNWMPNSFPVFNPGYLFSVDSVDTVKNQVMANAGNIFN